MRILGALLVLTGFFISLTIVGAIIGIPMMMIGVVFMAVGGRRKTIINNVVTVQHAPPIPGGPAVVDALPAGQEMKQIR